MFGASISIGAAGMTMVPYMDVYPVVMMAPAGIRTPPSGPVTPIPR